MKQQFFHTYASLLEGKRAQESAMATRTARGACGACGWGTAANWQRARLWNCGRWFGRGSGDVSLALSTTQMHFWSVFTAGYLVQDLGKTTAKLLNKFFCNDMWLLVELNHSLNLKAVERDRNQLSYIDRFVFSWRSGTDWSQGPIFDPLDKFFTELTVMFFPSLSPCRSQCQWDRSTKLRELFGLPGFKSWLVA